MNFPDHYISKLRDGDKKAFRILYSDMFANLCSFANKYINDRDASIDVVQDVFTKLWDNRKAIRYNTSLESFLFISVRNLSLNYIKKKNSKENLHQYYTDLNSESLYEFTLIENQVYNKVYNYIKELPKRSREIMFLTLNGVSNADITDELGISINTVKTLKKNSYRKMKEKFKNLF